jgi:hypothetical protein
MAALLVCGALAGCIPISRHYPLTPPSSGVYRAADGTPLPGAEIRLSSEAGDRTCRHPAARAVTDSGGRFQLPATKRVERVIWMIPVDPAPRPLFYLCAGQPARDGDGVREFAGSPFAEASVDSSARAPAVCLVARREDGRTIQCR